MHLKILKRISREFSKPPDCTNSGQAFEEEVSRFCKVEHAVAVSSCTSGLILAFAAGEFPDDSEVVLPSFTFAATVQAVLWN